MGMENNEVILPSFKSLNILDLCWDRRFRSDIDSKTGEEEEGRGMFINNHSPVFDSNV